MLERKIKFFDSYKRPAAVAASADAPSGRLEDTLSRPLQDLRISVTDRCNFRCVYCMPKQIFNKDYSYLQHSSLLSFDEITRMASLFVAHGVEKIRLTGGEPLLRKNIENLIGKLRTIPTPSGRPLDLTLTTNGALLAKKAQSLKDAGLDRVTVSLDSLDDSIFKRMNDVDFSVHQVLDGIDAAYRAGLGPIKINMVVKRGVNDSEILPMARHFKGSPYVLRFIEYMDVGASNGWNLEEVVPSAEIACQIAAAMPIAPVSANYAGETAARWRYLDGGGEIGLISSVTQAFCKDCSRARLSTEGKLYTCLFASSGFDFKAMLRAGCSDSEISAAISHRWRSRIDHYSETRTNENAKTIPGSPRVEMSYIGG
ncbi:MAG: GTP 3',8-cyclase MoaA [Telluria sp.]